MIYNKITKHIHQSSILPTKYDGSYFETDIKKGLYNLLAIMESGKITFATTNTHKIIVINFINELTTFSKTHILRDLDNIIKTKEVKVYNANYNNIKLEIRVVFLNKKVLSELALVEKLSFYEFKEVLNRLYLNNSLTNDKDKLNHKWMVDNFKIQIKKV